MEDAPEFESEKFSYLSLITERNFSSLWMARLISVLGDRLHQIALVALVISLTSTNLSEIALLWVTIALPSVLFGLFAGALVDRWSRSRVMVVADLIRVPIVVLIPVLGRVDLVWVYALLFLLTTAGLFFKPAYRAILPDIVSDRSLNSANSLTNTTESFMDVMGYPIAGAIVVGLQGLWGSFGIDVAFFLDAASYVLSALLISRVRSSETLARDAKLSMKNVFRMIGSGLAIVRSNAFLLANTLLFVIGPLIGASTSTLSAGYAAEVTHTGSFGYAVLEGAIGLGAVVGGVAVGRYGDRFIKGRIILIGVLLMGVGLGSLALFANLWGAVVMMALAGVGNMLLFIPSITLVQQLVDREYLGRMFSLRTILVSVAMIVSNAVAGVAAEQYGTQPVLGVCGALLLLVAGIAFLLPAARDAN